MVDETRIMDSLGRIEENVSTLLEEQQWLSSILKDHEDRLTSLEAARTVVFVLLVILFWGLMI